MSLEELRGIIRSKVRQYLNENDNIETDVVIVKRNRDLLRGGDFAVSVPKLWTTWPSQATLQIGKSLLESEGKEISKVHSNGGLLVVHLNRALFFRHVVSQVLQEEENYGRSESRPEKCCVYCVFHAAEDCTVDQLRTALLSQHIFNLLQANGYETTVVHRHQEEETKYTSVIETFQLLGISVDTHVFSQQNADEYMKKLAECTWRDKTESVTYHEGGAERDEEKKTDIVLDLRRFVSEGNLHFDKQGYTQNVGHLKITRHESKFQLAVDLAEFCKQHKVSKIVHVEESRREVQSQRIDLICRIIADENISHAHILHGGAAHAKGASVLSAKSYFSCRFAEMKKAFTLKYGDSQDGEEIAQRVAQAAVKFDLLAKSCSLPVKLSSDEKVNLEDSQMNSAGGVFVMYNFVRLSLLLEQFRKNVEKGLYSTLPDVSLIDFSLLREEEEWSLVYTYIATYPSVVSETVAAIDTPVPRPLVQSHKICLFLLDLARDFSVYYSRRHVLTEPRQHLVAVMYARLTLLTALRNVMHNALRLLNIEPLSRM